MDDSLSFIIRFSSLNVNPFFDRDKHKISDFIYDTFNLSDAQAEI